MGPANRWWLFLSVLSLFYSWETVVMCVSFPVFCILLDLWARRDQSPVVPMSVVAVPKPTPMDLTVTLEQDYARERMVSSHARSVLFLMTSCATEVTVMSPRFSGSAVGLSPRPSSPIIPIVPRGYVRVRADGRRRAVGPGPPDSVFYALSALLLLP